MTPPSHPWQRICQGAPAEIQVHLTSLPLTLTVSVSRLVRNLDDTSNVMVTVPYLLRSAPTVRLFVLLLALRRRV